jgi:hypothetical protein
MAFRGDLARGKREMNRNARKKEYALSFAAYILDSIA